MTDILIGTICLILTLAIILIRKGYFNQPDYEIKRQAYKNDAYARVIYPVVEFGSALRSLLWLLLALFTAISLVMFARIAPVWFGVGLDAAWLWLAFSWFPNAKATSLSKKLTILVNPLLLFILRKTHPGLSKFDRFLKHYATPHTRIYDPEDLDNFLDRQLGQADNRIGRDLLVRAKKLIAFESAKVSDRKIKWKDMMVLSVNEPIGPKLLDDLHKSGQKIFPVVQTKGSRDVVGFLDREDVGLKTEGLVKDFMRTKIKTAKEDDSLGGALDKLSKGGQSALIVLNKEGKVSGILTLIDCLTALMDADIDNTNITVEGGQQEYELVGIRTGEENENT